MNFKSPPKTLLYLYTLNLLAIFNCFKKLLGEPNKFKPVTYDKYAARCGNPVGKRKSQLA
jgi:hypothetical protein